MMMRLNFIWALLLLFGSLSAQKVVRFSQLEAEGLQLAWLDSVYTSAVHNDTSMAVFKSEAAQQNFIAAYGAFIQDFGKFLADHGFEFKQVQRCFNRVYFSATGTVDYFVYSFSNKNIEPQNQLTDQQLQEFERLLMMYLKTATLSVTAPVSFAQCSPVVYGKKK